VIKAGEIEKKEVRKSGWYGLEEIEKARGGDSHNKKVGYLKGKSEGKSKEKVRSDFSDFYQGSFYSTLR
jgi:hypothetical protein